MRTLEKTSQVKLWLDPSFPDFGREHSRMTVAKALRNNMLALFRAGAKGGVENFFAKAEIFWRHFE